MNKLKLLKTLTAKTFIRTVYALSALLFPIREKKVAFASYRSEKLDGNLFYVYQELVHRHSDIQFVFLFKKYRASLRGKLGYFFHLMRASYHLATSRYFFIDDYYFPVYVIKPRKGTEIIQLWHAAGAFKKFGYSTVGKTFGPSEDYLRHVKVHSNYSKVIVSSSEVIPFYAEAFNMPEKDILPLGVPRTDYFFSKENHKKVNEKFFARYPMLKGKKLILYAPTFRGKSHKQDAFQSPIDFQTMYRILGDHYAILVHLHPYMREDFNIGVNNNFVFHIKSGFDIQELLFVSDVLITDYSSIIFDYSLLDRPMAFFAHDLEEYERERGFYFEYQSFVPGPIFKETRGLAEWIKKGDYDAQAIAAFRSRFFDQTDGKASRRIVDYFFTK